jgi:glutaredoxin
MLDTLEYTDVAGTRRQHEITVYALSTCGFCKRALAFLNDKGFAYRFVYMDLLPLEVKTEAKRILKERFKTEVSFPFAVIDEKEYLVGFVESDWAKTLGV